MGPGWLLALSKVKSASSKAIGEKSYRRENAQTRDVYDFDELDTCENPKRDIIEKRQEDFFLPPV
jgi:hypothetical protein